MTTLIILDFPNFPRSWCQLLAVAVERLWLRAKPCPRHNKLGLLSVVFLRADYGVQTPAGAKISSRSEVHADETASLLEAKKEALERPNTQ